MSLNLPKQFTKSCRRCVSRPNMYLKDWKLTGQREGHFLYLWQVARVEINCSHSWKEVRIHDPYSFHLCAFVFRSWLSHESSPALKYKGRDLMSVTMQSGQVWRWTLMAFGREWWTKSTKTQKTTFCLWSMSLCLVNLCFSCKRLGHLLCLRNVCSPLVWLISFDSNHIH